MKQSIAIIGATGKTVSAWTKSLAGGDFRLLLMSDNPEALNLLINDIHLIYEHADIEAGNCPVECSWEADVIILDSAAVPGPVFLESLREVSTQKIVIGLNAQLKGSPDLEFGDIKPELQSLFPNSKVVNVLFGIDTEEINKDCLLSGNDEEAVENVAFIAVLAGYNPIRNFSSVIE